MSQQPKVTFGNKQCAIITQLYFQGTRYRIFQSTECNYVVKVYDVGQEKYLNTELQAVRIFNNYPHSNIAKSFEGDLLPNQKVLVFEKGEVLQNTLKDSQKGLKESDVLQILYDLSRALKHCHDKGITHRDIRPENILIGLDGQAKLWNFQRCSFQQYEHLPAEYVQRVKEEIEQNTLEHIRAPEQKDQPLRRPITTKVDLYALGQLMYYIIFKVRYDQNPNWENNVNWGVYSQELKQLIKYTLNPNPLERITAEELEKQVNSLIRSQNHQTIHVRSLSNNARANQKILETNKMNDKFPQLEFFIDSERPNSNLSTKIVKVVGKFAQKTDCWVRACLEELDAAPNQKYFRFLHGKAWQKKQKIPKFYVKLSDRLQLNSAIITFKSLLLLHNYVKKGPREVLYVDEKNYAPLNILEKIRQFQVNPAVKMSKDKFRTPFITSLLYNYTCLLIEKFKFHLFYKDFFEGNYAMVPFFNSINSHPKPKLSLAMLRNLLVLWKQSNTFVQLIFQENTLTNLQLALSLIMADEMYNLLCSCIHIFFAIKNSTNYSSGQQLNDNEVKQMLLQLQEDFIFNFQQTYHFLSNLRKIPQYQQIIPDPSRNAIDTIRQVPLFAQMSGDFNIYDFINYANSIDGLRLPQSYGETMSKVVIEYDDEVVELEARVDNFQNNENTIRPVLTCQPVTNRQNKFLFEQEERPKNNSQIQQSTSAGDQITPSNQAQLQETQSLPILEVPVDKKKPQPKQITQGGYQGLEISDEDDDSEHVHNHPNDQQTPTKEQLKSKNVQLSIELVRDKEFLNWGNGSNGNNGQVKRIQSANNNSFADIKFPVPTEIQKQQNGSIFDQFNFQQQQTQQQPQQQLLQQPLQQPQQQLIRQPTSNGFQVVDYFNKQGKNVSDRMIEFEQLKLDRKIGTGSSCEVFKGYWRGAEVAIKKMKIKSLSENHLKEFGREISALVSIKTHQNLVQLMGISQKDDELYIVTEYCAGGTLFDLLHKKTHIELPWPIRLKMAIQIAQGMLHLHELNPPLIHRDLKSLNLLLENTYEYNKVNIKIVDFGLARVQADNNERMTGVLGTFHWMAPEVFENAPYTIKADIFSFSIVLWEICCRETPYKSFSSNPHAIMRFVTIDKGRPDISLLQAGCPQYFKEIMIKCWDHDPNKRPSFGDIIQYLKRFQ